LMIVNAGPYPSTAAASEAAGRLTRAGLEAIVMSEK
jgi:hypothetical protein